MCDVIHVGRGNRVQADASRDSGRNQIGGPRPPDRRLSPGESLRDPFAPATPTLSRGAHHGHANLPRNPATAYSWAVGRGYGQKVFENI